MLLIRLVEVQRLLNSTSSREGNQIKYGVTIGTAAGAVPEPASESPAGAGLTPTRGREQGSGAGLGAPGIPERLREPERPATPGRGGTATAPAGCSPAAPRPAPRRPLLY